MLGYYNPSVILTYLSLVFASFGFSALLREEANVFAALVCLMLSGLCDMFDGAVARRCRRNEEEKLFGIQIDSLCDLVAFGALPACTVLVLSEVNFLSRIAAALLLLSSVIRLGYFNVQETLRDRSERREGYLGLPVTMTAILLPLLLLAGTAFSLSLEWYAPCCLFLIAALEVWRFPLKKPHGKEKMLVLFFGIVLFAILSFLGRRFF
ncbi:MAG: CDP-alcohol phosphatidyltransferase family protein [Clostridia bacterium]|nr:CDP-alcohol phosphatidyltransferase family protein [Clostridia bacterium]